MTHQADLRIHYINFAETIMRLNKTFTLQAVALATTLAFTSIAHAGLVNATTGNATVAGSLSMPASGSPVTLTGQCAANSTNCANSNSFTLYSGAANQVNVSFAGGAAVVTTPNTSNYAAPINGQGQQVSPYLSTNTTSSGTLGSYTLTFLNPQAYLGLLWGSIGTGDLLTFKNAGGATVATVNGTTAQNAATAFNPANGAQNFGGSQYEVINFLNGGTFSSVTFSQTVQAAFESGMIQYSATNVSPIPEPGSMLLLGIGAAGFVATRRRKAARA